MKRNFKKWVLVNEKGNVVIEGRHNKVAKELYHRYVYQHIFFSYICIFISVL